eukprot:15464177-Alexandrium_andersonii.AAC.1
MALRGPCDGARPCGRNLACTLLGGTRAFRTTSEAWKRTNATWRTSVRPKSCQALGPATRGPCSSPGDG